MEPREFVEAIDRAVAEFMTSVGAPVPRVDLDEPDTPELAAAALEGWRENPVGPSYALGYAAGEKAALTELKKWLERRFQDGEEWSSNVQVLRVIDEVRSRLKG